MKIIGCFLADMCLKKKLLMMLHIVFQKERSGADKIFLNTFGVFGNLNRSEGYFTAYDDSLWHKQRLVTIGYYTLLDHKSVTPTVDAYSEDCKWIYQIFQSVRRTGVFIR